MTDGLIHALLITESGKPQALDWNTVRTWKPEHGLLWLHLDANADEVRRWMDHDGRLPSVVPDAILAPDSRPRTTPVDGGVLLVLRGVNLNPGADPEDMVSVRLWVEPRRVVSTQIRRALSVEDVAESTKLQPLAGVGDLVVRLADRLVQRLTDVLDTVEERADAVERTVTRTPDQALRTGLADLRRETIALRRYLAPQRDALARLAGEPFPWLLDLDRQRLREINDRLTRHVEDLDAVRERMTVAQEELLSHLSDQLNRRMYVLSVIAAMFLPLGFLTGLLGINLGGIPGAESPVGFTAFSALLGVLMVFQLWFFRSRGWF